MDHLPRPSNPRLSPVTIEYKCTEPYDGGEPVSYPKRHGWEVLYSPYGIRYLHHGEKPGAGEIESLLQNWLYFGLLHEAFGKFMNIQDFIRKGEDGKSYITTEPLNDAVTSMSEGLEEYKDAPKPVQEAATARLWAVLEHTWRVSLNSIRSHKKDVVDERLWVSIAALVESIETILYGVFMDGGTNVFRQAGNPPVGKFMVEEMRSKGWCPFDVKRIDCTSKSVSMLYYLGNLPPPREHLDHTHCTDDLCTWMSIGPSYKTKHTQLDCGCDGFEDVEKVIEVLLGEGLPLIQRKKELDGAKAFKIIDSETGVDFVAISHVWAEGLGNPHSNSLPSCSLEWVQDLVNNLPGSSTTDSTPFWCDTLCVPIFPTEMHTIVMNRLRHPYQKATKVLVLDSYLYTKDSTKMSALEIWCSVVICSWSQRLWTFQESRLAKQVWFQFADRALQLEEIYYSNDTNMAQEILSQATLLAYRSHIVVRTRDPNFTPVPTVRIMREALRGRAVSVASDEALCVFCNMFLDMELVTSLPPEDRMAMFWRTIKQVPIGIVFSTATRKLTEPGLHWAPQSFMGDLETPQWLIEKWPPVNGHFTPRGLEMKVGGFMLSDEMLIWDDSFDTIFTDTQCQLRDDKGSWYWLELRGIWNQARTEFPGAREQLCLLMNMEVPEQVAGDDPFTFAPGVQGVIGTVEFDGPDMPPRFKGYRHIILHRYARALQDLHRSVYGFVEEYVRIVCQRGRSEMVAATSEDGDEEDEDEDLDQMEQTSSLAVGGQTRSLHADVMNLDINDSASPSQDEADDDDEEEEEQEEEEETPDTFQLSNERRIECQTLAANYARSHSPTRRLAVAHGRVQGRDEDAAIEQYGFHCRFQLQMRRRNRMWGFPTNAIWCID